MAVDDDNRTFENLAQEANLEELHDISANRGRTGGDQPHPPAEHVMQLSQQGISAMRYGFLDRSPTCLPEHEAVVERMRKLAVRAQVVDLGGHCPAEQRALNSRLSPG